MAFLVGNFVQRALYEEKGTKQRIDIDGHFKESLIVEVYLFDISSKF